MKQIQIFCERYGKWMFLFALIFTFAYSFFYSVHLSNHDYFFYMHLVDDGDYEKRPLIEGSILLSKPLWNLFGYKLWMWKVWSWVMACITAVIPYYALLNKEQRSKYAYLMALVILVLNLRHGLEPPRYVYLLNTIMLTCFIKYLQDNKWGWLVAVSVCVSLIAYVRFPSIFAWPVVIFAMLVLKKDWRHNLMVFILPIIIFIGFVTLTNGGIDNYFEELSGNVDRTASGSHSIMNLFWGYVTTTTHAIAYMILISLPLFMFGMCKKIESAIFKVAFVVTFFLIAAIMVIHPTEHLSCALTMAVVFVCAFCNNWNLKQIVLGATIVITNMFCSVGSDCGFAEEYYCVSFIPFMWVSYTDMEIWEKKSGTQLDGKLNMMKLSPLFTTLVMILCLSTFADKCISLGKTYKSGIISGGELSENLSGLFIDQQSMKKCSEMQKEYYALKQTHQKVIYWGSYLTHQMSFINSQWPVTDIWKISSKDTESKAFLDFVDFVIKNKPAIIDIGKHPNMVCFLKSQGYDVIEKECANVFVVKVKE